MKTFSNLHPRNLRLFGFPTLLVCALLCLDACRAFAQTPTNSDVFYMDHNVFSPSQGSLVIQVICVEYPGNYSLKIYNTAGEFIQDLSKAANNPSYLNTQLPPQTYYWDGTNSGGSKCASGVYIFHLIEPTGEQVKRVILIH